MNGIRALIIPLLSVAFLAGCGKTPHSYRFFTENDSYHPVERPDANYTSGILFMAAPARSFTKEENPGLDRLNFFEKDYNPYTIEYGIGQTFYTPDDIAVASLDDIDRNGRLLREDRPYAGLLFFQGAIHNHFTDWMDSSKYMRRSIYTKLGLTGNGSYSEEMHTAVHESRDLIIPVGWGMQVGQELAFAFAAEQRNRFLLWGKDKLFGADAVTNVKGTIGNIFTALEGGLTLRAGFNLPKQVQEDSIAPQNVSGSSDNRKSSSWHFYVFVGHQTRLVLRDYSIDGRLFSNDIHTVDREPLVNEFQYGGQIRFADNWAIQALFAHRDKQFETQRKEHSFGQYMIMYQRPIEVLR